MWGEIAIIPKVGQCTTLPAAAEASRRHIGESLCQATVALVRGHEANAYASLPLPVDLGRVTSFAASCRNRLLVLELREDGR